MTFLQPRRYAPQYARAVGSQCLGNKVGEANDEKADDYRRPEMQGVRWCPPVAPGENSVLDAGYEKGRDLNHSDQTIR